VQPVSGRADHRDIEGAPGGLSAQDLCPKHGISDATFYKWRSKRAGLDVSDARKLEAVSPGSAGSGFFLPVKSNRKGKSSAICPTIGRDFIPVLVRNQELLVVRSELTLDRGPAP
jgi:hypothetical protein